MNAYGYIEANKNTNSENDKNLIGFNGKHFFNIDLINHKIFISNCVHLLLLSVRSSS